MMEENFTQNVVTSSHTMTLNKIHNVVDDLF